MLKQILILVAGVLVVMSADKAFATPASGMSGVVSARSTFDPIKIKKSGDARIYLKSRDEVDVVTSTNIFKANGGHSGWHSHPGVVFVVIKKGTLTVYDAPKCQPRVFRAGEGFVEEGPDHVKLVRNEGTEDVELDGVVIVPVGAPTRIDAAQPSGSNCPVPVPLSNP